LREKERGREREMQNKREKRVIKADTIGVTVAHSDTIHNDTIRA
jgi:hypothetical protein